MMTTHRRVWSATAVFATLTLGLAACSGQDVVVSDPAQSAQSAATPNLDAPRIADMLKDAQKVINDADQGQSMELLENRMTDPALRMRKAQYALSAKTGKALPALDLTEQVLSVTNSTEWPRVLVDISVAPEGGLPHAYFFVQQDARSDYKLENWTRILGGTEFTTLSVKEGAPYLAPDASGFTMTPRRAVEAYVEMLNSGTAGSDLFAADEYTTKYMSNLKGLSDAAAAAGQVTATAQTVEGAPVTAVRLSDGSALVASTITYSQNYKRTVARSKMNLGGDAAVVAGNAEILGAVKVDYLLTVLIRVPVEGQDAKAQLIGVESALESVTKDDAARPEGE